MPPIVSEKPILAVLVHVPDVKAGFSWYQRAMVGSKRAQIVEMDNYEYLDVGSVILEIVPADVKVSNGAAGSVVYWHTPEFETSLEHFLNMGATLYRGPLSIEGGKKMCQVRDPWGNCIGLRGPSISGDSRD